MTLEEYLQQQGNQWRDRIDYGEDGGVAGAGWGRYVENDGGNSWQYVDDETLGYLQSNPSIYNPAPQTAQPTIEQPVVAQPQAPQPVALPTPRSLEEYLQQQGFNEYRKGTMGYGADMTDEITQKAGWGRTMSPIETEGGVDRYFQYAPPEVIDAYFNNPSNFINARETPFGQGINTFNEGNADQKKVIDQINTGQLRIVPATAPDDLGRLTNDSFKVVDSRTGQTVNQQVIAIDKDNGVFSILADDPNSSGFFRNYVSTDPSGFVNPIVSEEQSQYNSRANNSLNFIKDSIKGLITMGGVGATALGAGAALGSATGLGTVGGNIALNTGLGALKQAVDGQFNPLGLATSAALSYGLGGAGGADPLTADDMYTGQAMTNLASSDDATRLADLVRAFENPTELTGPTIDVADKVSIENPSVIDSQAPVMPSNLQDTAYLDPGLIDVAPENVTIGTPDATPYFDASPTFPTLDVSPEYDPNAYLPTNLGGYTGIPTDLGGLDVPFDTTAPTDLTAGELTVSGTQDTFDPWDNPEPLPYTPFEEDFPLQEETTPLTKPKILSNILKSTPSALPKAIATQQQSNLANILRGSQMPQTALPPIYKQANPFNFGQQATPVQDTTALAKLLRTA